MKRASGCGGRIPDEHAGINRNLQAVSGGVQAVDQVSLTLKEGELGVLVGPSGCGKTTTLRMIAGLETPDEGTIRIRGQAVEGQRPQDRDVAMMFQSSALFPWLSVAENLAFGLAKKNLDRHGRQSQIEAIARQLQLEGFA